MIKRAAPLDPNGRCTLRDVLRPPDGYRLEHALGTAYSLDAETLVTIPLFAAGIGAEDLNKSVGISRIYELGTRLTLLVQGDRIAISSRWASSKPLLRLVGDAVVPSSIKGGSFHPKLLVLHFNSIDQPGRKVFRIVVATRNLTTDNSWDSVVVLDEAATGVLIPGLAETVSGLAQFVNDQSHPAVKRCGQIGSALKDVRFQPLHGVTDLEVRLFHLGSKNADNVFKKIKGDDLLIISPFVGQAILDRLAAQAGNDEKKNRWLVTRPVDVPDKAFTKYQIFKISDAAVPTHDMSDAQSARGRLVGLHAKIYLASSKKGGTRLVVTSANATLSGWERNVEVAVTGVTKAKALQVPALLVQAETDPDQERTFRGLLEEITPSAVECAESDPPWVKRVRSVLAGAVAVGWVRNGPPRTLGVTIDFLVERSDWPNGVEITMHPFGYSDRTARLALGKNRMSGSFEIEPGIELTPFGVLTLIYGDDAPLQIVLAMQLKGDLDWLRKDALATLARSARPDLYRELLWYFGVKGQSRSSRGDTVGGTPAAKGRGSSPRLPILEKVLLRVHGPNAQVEIATIESLLTGLTDEPEDERLAVMWRLVKESLR